MTLTDVYRLMLEESPELASVSFYDHIEVDEGQEIYPPFIVFREVGGSPFHADDRVYYLTINHQIDLYTADRSPSMRMDVVEFLNRNSLPFTLDMSDFDSETGLYVDSFRINLE